MSGFTHLIVGDGPMRGRVEQEVRRDGHRHRTVLAGSRDDVADLLSASDVVLFASLSDGMEGMPAAVIEAGMMGRTVVGYAVAGVPEVVEDGTTGLLVRPGDVAGLASAALALLSDGERQAAMGAAAEERCRSRFDVRTVAPQYARIYEELTRSNA
jgi:glycosyltransferase involved in cell wall biosynthesis